MNMSAFSGTTRRDARSAFTLVEVLVSLVILSVGIVVVLRAFETALVALADTQEVLWSTLVGGERISEARILAAEGGEWGAGDSSGVYSAPQGTYRWRTTVTSVAEDLDQVAVTVSREGSDRAYSFVTYLVP
jgi:prepilin-type N-terminal cleavage/methylation domain-containing protein